MAKFEKDPKKIVAKSHKFARSQLPLDDIPAVDKQIITSMLISNGNLSLYDDIRISQHASKIALERFDSDYELICDNERVMCALKTNLLKQEPICLTTKANIISQAKANKQTRSMIAVDSWKPFLEGSIVLIGSEPTALFRLLELLETDEYESIRPALVIATPCGFLETADAKQALWDAHESLGIECITLSGTQGGSVMAAEALNALLNFHQGIKY